METLTREELYNLVWSEPIIKIAPRYGLSDRGFGKLCARHDIPVPPRGCWARKAAGKRVTPTPLPNPGKTVGIVFDRPKTPKETAALEPDAVPSEIVFERDPVNFVLFDPHARITHPLVKAASVVLRSQRPAYNGIVQSGFKALDIRVAPASVSRALRVMQTLILALQKRGYSVQTRERATDAIVLGEKVQIVLRERLKQTIRELTPDEQRRRREGLQVTPFDLRPTGELSVNIARASGRSIASDSGSKKLEDYLNLFIEALVRDAHEQKNARARREEEERKRQEAERKRIERRKLQLQELARIDRFDRLAKYWRKAEERRAFLSRLREAIGAVEEASGLDRWLKWADAHVEMSDPLERFKAKGGSVTVYVGAYSHQIAKIKKEGFEDPEPLDYSR